MSIKRLMIPIVFAPVLNLQSWQLIQQSNVTTLNFPVEVVGKQNGQV